jgi:amidase
MPEPTSDLCELDALALSAAVHSRQTSCREVMQAYLQRISRLNPRFNALVNLQDGDTLLRQADACDAQLARGESQGWLHGVPLAVKDMVNVAGIPTTMGSPLMRHFVPKEDALMVQRLRNAGAIVIAKTNVPEFALGSHTFNPVFGPTRNAYDPALSAGGSSGGAAVALALRLLPVADGSDFMGSLRNPAGWANVYGMRPSQGRVPAWPVLDSWVNQLSTDGPMGRTVADVARLLATQAGHDPRAPLSLAGDGSEFAQPVLPLDAKGLRIGWLADLQGYLPMEPGILATCERALLRLQTEGCTLQPAALGMAPEKVWQAWLVWRRALVASRISQFLLNPKNREQIKPEALWEHEQATRLSGNDFMHASVQRTQFYQHMLALFDQNDFLALPSAQVWPFDVNERWPQHINGQPMDTYHRWMEVVVYATFAGLPAISVPAGFNQQGLPCGLQLIGRPRGDWDLLRLARLYELAAADVLGRRPALP